MFHCGKQPAPVGAGGSSQVTYASLSPLSPSFFLPEKEEDSHSYQNITIGVSHGSDPGRCVAVMVCVCRTKVSGSTERDGDLLSQGENPLVHRLSSSYQLCAGGAGAQGLPQAQSRPGTFPLSPGKCTWWYLTG